MSAKSCSAAGPRWMPPTPQRFGSMNRSESFHIGLVNSTTASSRPSTGLHSRWAGPQPSHSHFSSTGERGTIERTWKSCRYKSGRRFRRVDDRQRDIVEIGQLVGHDADRPQHDADRFGPALVKVDQVLRLGFGVHPLPKLDDRGRRQGIKSLADAAVETQTAEPEFFGRSENDHRQSLAPSDRPPARRRRLCARNAAALFGSACRRISFANLRARELPGQPRPRGFGLGLFAIELFRQPPTPHKIMESGQREHTAAHDDHQTEIAAGEHDQREQDHHADAGR